MKRRVSLAVFVALVVGLIGGPSQASAVEEVYSKRTMEISRNLSCPICEGQTVADSQSRLAIEMRNTIESQVQSGWTDQEIYDFFVARFGEEVLVEPPREGINLALWWIPVAAVGLGALVLVLYFRESRRVTPRDGGIAGETAYEAELDEIAREVLGEQPPDSSRLVDSRRDP